MFIDASALVAMLTREPDADHIALKMRGAKSLVTSPLSRYEAVLAIARIRNIDIDQATQILNHFLAHYGIHTSHITEDIGNAAIMAFDRYGKGRHKAALNLGDCFSYAFARINQMTILCKGNDFPETDARIA